MKNIVLFLQKTAIHKISRENSNNAEKKQKKPHDSFS